MEPSRKIIMLIYGRAFSFLLSLLIPFFLTRLLLKEDYGSYQQLVMIYTIVQAILLFGMPQSLLYYYPRKDPNEHPLLIKQTWIILVCSALLIMSLFWLGSQMIDSHHLKEYLILLGIYTSLMIFVMPIQNLLILEGKTGAAMWSMILFAVIDVAILPTAAWLNPTTLGILHGIILAASLKVVMVLFHVYSTYFTKEILGNSYLKEQLAYGIPVGLTAMVYVINVNVDKYLVGLFFSSSVFAVYYLGSLWAPIFGWITQSAAQVVTPLMSKAHKEGKLSEIKDLYRSSISKLAFVFLPATILLIFIAEPLIITLFTDTYSDSVPIFMIYLILLPTYSLNLGWILMASGQTKFLLKLALSMSIINIILSYWLLTTLEGDNRLLGIPFSTVLVTWISTIIVMNRSLATIESSFLETYPVEEMWKIASVSALSVLPVILLSALELSNPLTLFLSIIIFGIIFLSLSYKLKLIGDNEIKLVKSFFPF
ncbi:MAG: oligosaccharide flippase family protein [Candidatus Poseidoniia archaeon]|nr:oligosaccharide flippase family protein [Candidatus Poseidoniia archaeon]